MAKAKSKSKPAADESQRAGDETKRHLDKIQDAINAKLGGKTPATAAGRASAGALSDVREVIPTGITAIDHYVLGCGGIPVGLCGEIFSEANTGKTSLGMQLCAAAQRAGGVAILIETEKTLQTSRLPVFGVNAEDLLLVQPRSIEEVLNAMRSIFGVIPPGVGPNVIVWDSLAATELDKQSKDDYYFGVSSAPGKRALLMSEAIPVLLRLARERRCAIAVINQIRNKIGVVFGSNETTPGGNSLKFHASWRFQLWGGAAWPEGTSPQGIHTTVKAIKSKVGPPLRKARLRLNWYTGWDDDWSTMQLGRDLGVVPGKARVSKAHLNAIRQHLGISG